MGRLHGIPGLQDIPEELNGQWYYFLLTRRVEESWAIMKGGLGRPVDEDRSGTQLATIFQGFGRVTDKSLPYELTSQQPKGSLEQHLVPQAP